MATGSDIRRMLPSAGDENLISVIKVGLLEFIISSSRFLDDDFNDSSIS
jgi:hypothetical protein|tara:strand:- start:1422 stop:1568 length:147 start_codon:yes stop_codon:yes gene_type:complete